VKRFDPIQKEVATAKLFLGSYAAVRSHWNSLTPYEATTEEWREAGLILGLLRDSLDLVPTSPGSFPEDEDSHS